MVLKNIYDSLDYEIVASPAWLAHEAAYSYLSDFYAQALRFSPEPPLELISAYHDAKFLDEKVFLESNGYVNLDLEKQAGDADRHFYETLHKTFRGLMKDGYHLNVVPSRCFYEGDDFNECRWEDLDKLDDPALPVMSHIPDCLVEVLSESYARSLYSCLRTDSVDISGKDFFDSTNPDGFQSYQQKALQEVIESLALDEADNLNDIIDNGTRIFSDTYFVDGFGRYSKDGIGQFEDIYQYSSQKKKFHDSPKIPSDKIPFR